MPDAIKFFFDEHVPKVAARALRKLGADVLTVVQAQRVTFPDDEQLRFATGEDRVVVTHDEDYTDLAADFTIRGEEFAGVAYCHPDKYKYQVGQLIFALGLIFTAATASEFRNHLEYL